MRGGHTGRRRERSLLNILNAYPILARKFEAMIARGVAHGERMKDEGGRMKGGRFVFSSSFILPPSSFQCMRPPRSEARGKLGRTRKEVRQRVTRSPTRSGAAVTSGLARVTMTGTPRRRSGASEIS